MSASELAPRRIFHPLVYGDRGGVRAFQLGGDSLFELLTTQSAYFDVTSAGGTRHFAECKLRIVRAQHVIGPQVAASYLFTVLAMTAYVFEFVFHLGERVAINTETKPW